MAAASVTGRVWFTGAKIIQAIKFHLVNEGWFETVPDGLTEWLRKEIRANKKISVKKSDWEETRSGTQRMLWLMVASSIDPYECCKWAQSPGDAKAMHQRFTNIIQSWGDSD